MWFRKKTSEGTDLLFLSGLFASVGFGPELHSDLRAHGCRVLRWRRVADVDSKLALLFRKGGAQQCVWWREALLGTEGSGDRISKGSNKEQHPSFSSGFSGL